MRNVYFNVAVDLNKFYGNDKEMPCNKEIENFLLLVSLQ